MEDDEDYYYEEFEIDDPFDDLDDETTNELYL
jgi:hypothetical protein